MAKEKNLTAVTSVAAADFARVVTSAGASVKATFANVAKYIIETYNGSTVAGSAQSVKSALDSLNSKTVSGFIAVTPSIAGNADYNFDASGSVTGSPKAIWVQGWTPSTTWDTWVSVQDVYTSNKTIRLRTHGTATQTYTIRVLAFYD